MFTRNNLTPTEIEMDDEGKAIMNKWWSDWDQKWKEEDEQDTYFCDVCGHDYTLEDPCEFH